MYFSTIVAATAFAGAALAEDHKVAVGTKDGKLEFMPDSIKAVQGDTVTFSFWPKNHSVAQATFAKPCEPMANGFWSGYVPTSDTNAVAQETFTYTVTNASAPIWLYCSQAKHCQSGMVAAINAPTSGERTLAAFKNAAMAAANNVAPSSVAGTGGKLAKNGSATSPSRPSGSGSASGSGSSRPSGSGSASGSGSSPESTGAAVHLAGSASFAGLTGLMAYLLI